MLFQIKRILEINFYFINSYIKSLMSYFYFKNKMTQTYFLFFFSIVSFTVIFSQAPIGSVPGPKPVNSSNSSAKSPNNSNVTKPTKGSMANTLNDGTQLGTFTFDALSWYTGNLCSDSFLPGGKVADFFGFQYLREQGPGETGHSTVYVSYCAKAVMSILNSKQLAILQSLASNTSVFYNLTSTYALNRYPLYYAFRKLYSGKLPQGTSGLNKEAIKNYTSKLYTIDAQISVKKATAFGQIINSLDQIQLAFLKNMVAGGFNSWPVNNSRADANMMGLASEMFSWFAGNLTSDVYFCPERVADYFGSFYLKDGLGIGTTNYSVAAHITGGEGMDFYSYLNSIQQTWFNSLIEKQKNNLNTIVNLRTNISKELRKAYVNQAVNQDLVVGWEAQYGSLDGEIAYYYATTFSQLGNSLNQTQISKMNAIPIVTEMYSALCSKNPGISFVYDLQISQPIDSSSDTFFI